MLFPRRPKTKRLNSRTCPNPPLNHAESKGRLETSATFEQSNYSMLMGKHIIIIGVVFERKHVSRVTVATVTFPILQAFSFSHYPNLSAWKTKRTFRNVLPFPQKGRVHPYLHLQKPLKWIVFAVEMPTTSSAPRHESKPDIFWSRLLVFSPYSPLEFATNPCEILEIRGFSLLPIRYFPPFSPFSVHN